MSQFSHATGWEPETDPKLRLELPLFCCLGIASKLFVSILVQVEFERKVSLGEVIHVLPKLGQGRPSHWICRSAPATGNSLVLLCLNSHIWEVELTSSFANVNEIPWPFLKALWIFLARCLSVYNCDNNSFGWAFWVLQSWAICLEQQGSLLLWWARMNSEIQCRGKSW